MAAEDEDLAAEVPAGRRAAGESCSTRLELKALLSGPLDANSALLTINARDGGTDANDWAEMLLRMYLDWAKDHDYETELLDRQDNEEAGINSATIAVRGPLAYGYLKGESGHPPPGAHQPLQRRRQAADQFRRRGRRPRGLRTGRRSKSATRTSARTCFGPAGPAASTSTRPPAPSG